jgi:hypothetical protein
VPLGVLERLTQQHVRPARGLVRLEVVRLLEIDRVDLFGRHELQYLDGLVGRDGQLGEILVGEDHHAAVLQLVALRDVAVLDLVAAHLADALVPDPAPILGVDLVEPEIVFLGRAEHPDGDSHQPERDGTSPHGSHSVLGTHCAPVFQPPTPGKCLVNPR